LCAIFSQGYVNQGRIYSINYKIMLHSAVKLVTLQVASKKHSYYYIRCPKNVSIENHTAKKRPYYTNLILGDDSMCIKILFNFIRCLFFLIYGHEKPSVSAHSSVRPGIRFHVLLIRS
jgi:hypothetical protein